MAESFQLGKTLLIMADWPRIGKDRLVLYSISAYTCLTTLFKSAAKYWNSTAGRGYHVLW